MSVINCALCQAPVDTDFDTTYEACEGCAVESDEQREEIAELRKDKARVDWHEANPVDIWLSNDSGNGWYYDGRYYKTFREGADAALSTPATEGEPAIEEER